MSETESQRTRRRWINFGELIALAALIVSAVGVWINWKSSDEAKPTAIVEQRPAIPLTLRAKANEDGRKLDISPVESSHALESLILTIKGSPPIELGSDGELNASDVESALKGHENEAKDKDKDKVYSVPVRIAARYVEMGKDRHGGGDYVLRYKWEGGGLFGGRSLHLVGLSRG
jgi:hypothetical protein